MTLITKNPKQAAEYLKKGYVVALPTETVYGLGASIHHEEALREIFQLKNRPQDNPLIVHAYDLDMVSQFADVTEDFIRLYKDFMPGPLSVLLDKKTISDTVTCGLNTVAVRIPSSTLFRDVLKSLGEPIAAPSANLSGKPSSTEAHHVFNDFSPHLALILDGGPASGGIESTIVRVYSDHGVILRPGLITKAQLESCLNRPFMFAAKNAALEAPGMKYRHYAPSAKILLIDSFDSLKSENDVMVMAQDHIDHPHYEKLSSQNLYSAFRKADLLGLKKIYILIDKTLNEGLLNRVRKAAS